MREKFNVIHKENFKVKYTHTHTRKAKSVNNICWSGFLTNSLIHADKNVNNTPSITNPPPPNLIAYYKGIYKCIYLSLKFYLPRSVKFHVYK